MSNEEKFFEIMTGTGSLTKKLARDFNIDPEDLSQELSLKVWENIDKIDTKTERYRGLIKLQARDIAISMRKANMVSRADTAAAYCPKDIRGALKAGCLLPESQHPMRADIVRALKQCTEEERTVVFRNYVLSEDVGKPARAKMYRTIDKISDMLNGYRKADSSD